MKYDCEIIRDLLPLYAEEIASPASTAMVRAHLEECPDCARLLAQMQRPVPVRAETAAPLQKLKKTLWKSAWVTALAVCAVTAVCVGGGYGLYNHTTPVTLEQAALWPFVTQMEGKVYVVETQGRNVRLEVCPEVGFGGMNAVRAVEITGFRRGVDRLLHLAGAGTPPGIPRPCCGRTRPLRSAVWTGDLSASGTDVRLSGDLDERHHPHRRYPQGGWGRKRGFCGCGDRRADRGRQVSRHGAGPGLSALLPGCGAVSAGLTGSESLAEELRQEAFFTRCGSWISCRRSRMSGPGCLRWPATAGSRSPQQIFRWNGAPSARAGCWRSGQRIRRRRLRCISACISCRSRIKRCSACGCSGSCPLSGSEPCLATMRPGPG